MDIFIAVRPILLDIIGSPVSEHHTRIVQRNHPLQDQRKRSHLCCGQWKVWSRCGVEAGKSAFPETDLSAHTAVYALLTEKFQPFMAQACWVNKMP